MGKRPPSGRSGVWLAVWKGQFAAEIRSKRPPSPYGDNKGIRYRDEAIRKKAGKAFGDKK